MFGANKRLRDLGKDTATMYNPSTYGSTNNKTYVVNTKKRDGVQVVRTSRNAAGIIMLVIFSYIAIFGFYFFNRIFGDFSYITNEYEDEYTEETLVIPNIYEEKWANEFYYYLTQSSAVSGIKCDEIAFADLNFDNNPELLVRSNGTGLADYIIEYNGNMKFNNIYVSDDLNELKLYKYNERNLKWGIVKNKNGAYAQDPVLDIYWMRDVLNNNKYEPDFMLTFKSMFDELYSTTNAQISFTKIVESEKDFRTALDNYYYQNVNIQVYENN